MDIAAESAETVELGAIAELQALKTGALFGWSAAAGPVMAENDPGPMLKYASAFGLAFQIADDLLDATGDEVKAGKRLNKDARAGKATFVAVLGEPGARAKAQELIETAKTAVAPLGAKADKLIAAADFVLSRQR